MARKNRTTKSYLLIKPDLCDVCGENFFARDGARLCSVCEKYASKEPRQLIPGFAVQAPRPARPKLTQLPEFASIEEAETYAHHAKQASQIHMKDLEEARARIAVLERQNRALQGGELLQEINALKAENSRLRESLNRANAAWLRYYHTSGQTRDLFQFGKWAVQKLDQLKRQGLTA